MSTPNTTRPSLHRAARLFWAAGAAAAVAATVAIAVDTSSWIGRPFPGFFLLDNRIIPSIGLIGWSGTRDGALHQHAVVAIDGMRIGDGDTVYATIARRPVGSVFAYTLRSGASTETVHVRSMTFSTRDYGAIFGAYLITGALYLLVALLAPCVAVAPSLSRALVFVGGVGGIYALSGAEIYAGGFLRLHALAEAYFPATLVHLGLVFPRGRTRGTTIGSALACWLSLTLAVPYQLLLDDPTAYSLLHAACELYMGIAGLALTAFWLVEHAAAERASTPLLGSAVAGALLGLGGPAVIFVLSAVSGGALPINICTASAFLFPLGIAYGLLTESKAVRMARSAPVAVAVSVP